MKHIIGLSLSTCIADIIKGLQKEDHVDKIIAATCIRNEEDLDAVIQTYRKYDWNQNPDLGEEITRRMFAAGKIEQPRITGEELPSRENGYWINPQKQFSKLSTSELLYVADIHPEYRDIVEMVLWTRNLAEMINTDYEG